MSLAEPESELAARAADIHRRVLVLDAHVDVLLPETPSFYRGPDGLSRAEPEKLQRGGVDAAVFAIAVGPGARTLQSESEAFAEANAKLQAVRHLIASRPNDMTLALSAGEVINAHKQGKIAVLQGFLNARSLGRNLHRIEEFYQGGVRVFGFVHIGNNDFADSSRPDGEPRREHGGLSTLGTEAVHLLNQLGVVIDVSQLTTEGLLQTLELSSAPVIASHSAARALLDTERNLSDAELQAIKDRRGVVCVTPFNNYLVPLPEDFGERVAGLRARYGLGAAFAKPTDGIESLPPADGKTCIEGLVAIFHHNRASIADYVNHIDYIAHFLGIDHVGIGTDFDHGAGIVGFEDESEAPNVTRELVRRGYSEEQIGKIWSGNFLRVFGEVQDTASAVA